MALHQHVYSEVDSGLGHAARFAGHLPWRAQRTRASESPHGLDCFASPGIARAASFMATTARLVRLDSHGQRRLVVRVLHSRCQPELAVPRALAAVQPGQGAEPRRRVPQHSARPGRRFGHNAATRPHTAYGLGAPPEPAGNAHRGSAVGADEELSHVQGR